VRETKNGPTGLLKWFRPWERRSRRITGGWERISRKITQRGKSPKRRKRTKEKKKKRPANRQAGRDPAKGREKTDGQRGGETKKQK